MLVAGALVLAQVPAVLCAPVADAHARRSRSSRSATPARGGRPASPELLACIRHWESRGNYEAASRSGRYGGAYQFDQRTWDAVARRHWPENVGIAPSEATEEAQDFMAARLLEERGLRPWPTPRKRCG